MNVFIICDNPKPCSLSSCRYNLSCFPTATHTCMLECMSNSGMSIRNIEKALGLKKDAGKYILRTAMKKLKHLSRQNLLCDLLDMDSSKGYIYTHPEDIEFPPIQENELAFHTSVMEYELRVLEGTDSKFYNMKAA